MPDNQSTAPRKQHQGNRKPNNRRNYRGGRGAKKKPLTLWQKFLKLLGFGKSTKKPNKKGPAKKKNTAKRPVQPRNPEEVATSRLYVGNLSYEVTEFELEDLFKGIGNVKEVEIIYNRHTHRSKGYAFVDMGTIEEAKRSIEVLHDQPFMGRQLNISGAKARQPKED